MKFKRGERIHIRYPGTNKFMHGTIETIFGEKTPNPIYKVKMDYVDVEMLNLNEYILVDKQLNIVDEKIF